MTLKTTAVERPISRASVTVSESQTYLVRSASGMDYAEIYLRCGKRQKDHFGSITVNSSFGCFGHHFSNTGARPLKEFLLGVQFDYLMGKCFGESFKRYDYAESMRAVRKLVAGARRRDEICATEAQKLWEGITQAEMGGPYQDASSFHRALQDELGCAWSDWDMGEIVGTSVNPQARGFWEEIWPHFTAELKTEIAASHVRIA